MIIVFLLKVPLVFSNKNINGKSEKLDNLSVEQLTEIGDKDIDQKSEYLKAFRTNSN